MRVAFILILLAVIVLPDKIYSQESRDNEGNQILARINDEIITVSDLRKKIANNMPKEGQDSYMKRTLQQMAQDALFTQAAKNLGIDISESEIDKEVDNEIKLLGSKEDFNKWLKFRNINMEQYRGEIKKGLLVGKLLRNKYQAWLTTPSPENPVLEYYVPPEDIKNFYEENKDKFAGINEITVGIIVIRYGSQAEKSEKKDIAESVLRRLKEGTNFSLLAQETSDFKSQIYRTGLKIGQTGFSKDVDDLLFNKLKEGEVSKIIEMSDAFNIFKLVRKDTENAKTFEDAQYQIRTMLEQQKQASNREKLLGELVKRAYIWPPELFQGIYR